MPPIQTVFNERTPVGLKGRRVDMGEWNTITMLPEDDSVGVAVPVMQGTSDDQIVEYDGDGFFRGITELDQVAVYDADDNYAQGYNVPVMEFGVIWVVAGAAVVVGTAANFDAATKNWSTAGTVEVPGAFFISSGASGDLVKVRIGKVSIPGPAGPQGPQGEPGGTT